MHIVTEIGKEHDYAIKLAFKMTNNESEYEALLVGMSMARLLGATEVEMKENSQVVVSQVLGEFSKKGEKLKKYLEQVCKEHDLFRYFRIQQIMMGENQKADWLAMAASGQEESPLPEHTVI